ncbi:MAG: hypothetical protein Q7O66_23775 [Dehalococcoidia bacterium]|nr:hypothetical protein [Dehalococcoidia bacterium]
MELRQYFQIIWRRIWIPVVITILVGISSIALTPKPETSYVASMRFLVGVPPETSNGNFFTFDRYYTWVSSEYLLDDLSELVKSDASAADVKKELKDATFDVGSISGRRNTAKTHRVMIVSFSGDNPDHVLKVAQASLKVLQNNASTYFAQLGYDKAGVNLIDPPAVTSQVNVIRNSADTALRVVLGFIAGLAIIFLLDYLDTSIRDTSEVERLVGLRVLGEIPRG